MEKNYSQIYRDDILKLVQSIVIRNDQTAAAVNLGLQSKYGESIVDQNDRSTWKYYLNVSGRYHPKDTVMYVKSMDTLATIEFSRANLEVHRATAKGYAFGTDVYKELVIRYPGQEQVIRGILYPCDLQTAIDAKDGTILAYPSELVESWEYSLIPNLQEWIYGFYYRWNNNAFNLSDELFHPAFLSVLYSTMVGQIYCQRTEACHTNEVHSYHLRNFLGSHGDLDRYMSYLTREQALWLYRNIRYIERHAGHQDTFTWLVEWLFTKRSLPLASYDMRHNLELMPDEFKPHVVFHRTKLNRLASASSRDNFEVSEIFDKEEKLARDNAVYRDDFDASAASRMANAATNQLKTKLLESSMIDPEGSEHFLLTEVRFYQWLYMANNGKYRAVIPYTSPITGETVYLTAIDAFTLYTFLYCAKQGIILTELPTVIAKRALRQPRAQLADIMSVATDRVPMSFGLRMLELIPQSVDILSIDQFSEHCVEIWRCANWQWYEVCQEEAFKVRGMKQSVMNRCWCNQTIQLGTAGQSYANFFAANNLDIADYSEGEVAIAHDTLLQSALGVKASDESSMVGIQRAMAEILLQLSSYSIQLARDINTSAIRDVGTIMPRFDDIEAHGYSSRYIEVSAEVLKHESHGYSSRVIRCGDADPPMKFRTHDFSSRRLSVGMNVTAVTDSTSKNKQVGIGTSMHAIPVELEPLPAGYEGYPNVHGMAQFLALPEELKRTLPINVL